MDKEISNYIRTYFSHLMTNDEKLALKYHLYTFKTEDNPQMRKVMIDKGWISERPVLKELLKNGYDEFELNVARRIMKETPEKIYLNNCSKCNKLARTPYAKQCRHCGHSWYDLTVAQFKISDCFQLTDRHFFLLEKITCGEINQGQYMDLMTLGLNARPKIQAIEFALKQSYGKVWEDIGLGTDELSQEDKEFLKNSGSLGKSIDIIKSK